MENSTSASGFIASVLLPDNGVRGQVQIGFLLKDTLNVVEVVEGKDTIIMSQCCYEQKIISMHSSDVDDKDRVKEVVKEALLEMHKNLHTEESECPEVERLLPQLVNSTRRNNPSFGTVLLEIRIEAVTDKQNDDLLDTPPGEHGIMQLVQRCAKNCPICLKDFDLPKDLIVTACRHAFHKACIFRRLQKRSHSCPVCQFNLAPMTGPGHIQFDW